LWWPAVAAVEIDTVAEVAQADFVLQLLQLIQHIL
jgi:hypothetical protein